MSSNTINAFCAKQYGIKDINNYDTVVLSLNPVECKNILTQERINIAGTKYIVKWNYDLDGKTITVPEGCLIEFDGGSFCNGTLVGQNTILIYYQDRPLVLKDVIMSGEFIIYSQEVDCYQKKQHILIEEDGIYQIKDNKVYPVAHPDLSTQTSTLSQRFGNLSIKEVLIAPGRENEIPLDAKIINAFSFNDTACAPASCQKETEGWVITPSLEILPEFTLIQYAINDGGYYYG